MGLKPRLETAFERLLFQSRWLMAPFYVGLVLALLMGGDLANEQLLVSAVGWADALLQGLVLLAKRDDAAGY